ncbi:MAG: DUF4401 domain-containing protein [Zoogloeaceae bacterium]|jgi:hypothetical protein|nr:DUF4401 domain-containing protein [Zoogloeaceae bacterium]
MKIFAIRETPEMFWQTLVNAGLVQGNMPADPAAFGEGSPWYVKVMLGGAAWISAGFFLLSVLLFTVLFLEKILLENAEARAILGIAACALAAWYFRKQTASPFSAFVEQILFIAALLGQALVLSAIFQASGSNTLRTGESFWLQAAFFEAIVLVAIPYLPNRFLSALAALFFLRGAMYFEWGNTELFMPLCLAALAVVLHFQWRAFRLWPAVALALCLDPFFAPIIQEPSYLLDFDYIQNSILEQGGLILVWLGIVYSLLRKVTGKPFASKNMGVWVLALLLAAGTWPVQLALFALAVFFLGFSQRDRLLEGIGIAQLLWSVGFYYYALQDTLLFKSLMLSFLGMTLLLLLALGHTFLPQAEPNEGEKA